LPSLIAALAFRSLHRAERKYRLSSSNATIWQGWRDALPRYSQLMGLQRWKPPPSLSRMSIVFTSATGTSATSSSYSPKSAYESEAEAVEPTRVRL